MKITEKGFYGCKEQGNKIEGFAHWTYYNTSLELVNYKHIIVVSNGIGSFLFTTNGFGSDYSMLKENNCFDADAILLASFISENPTTAFDFILNEAMLEQNRFIELLAECKDVLENKDILINDDLRSAMISVCDRNKNKRQFLN